MLLTLPAIYFSMMFVGSLFCSWFQCEISTEPPFVHVSMESSKQLLSAMTGYRKPENDKAHGPVVHTKVGPVEGYVGQNSEGRPIFKFTGIPYGENPTGHHRFRDPIPRRPWNKTLKATSDSPYCIQINGHMMGMLRGQEDCLYLDVHTPSIPNSRDKVKHGVRLPVIIWIPAGVFVFGRSSSYGSAYLLREDVVLVTINVRLGVLGYLATGDEASSGNWGLKDQALAVQWVYDNIEAFGGDPNRITIGGFSSGSAAAHSMLFSQHKARNYIKGIYGMSGSCFSGFGLDTTGRVVDASNIVASVAGCPKSDKGNSFEMVECLRKLDPYVLSAYQSIVYVINENKKLPFMSKMFGPTIEPNVTNAYITELPEALYEKGEVPPIPVILTRTEDETGFYMQRSRSSMFPIYSLLWHKLMPIASKLGYRNTKLGEEVTIEQGVESIRKLDRFYFGRDSAPGVLRPKDFRGFVNLTNDGLFNVPCWKALELHNKIAPTYSYIARQRSFSMNPWVRLAEGLLNEHFAAPHVTDYFMFFNNTRMAPPLKPGTEIDIASKHLVNMIVNFATYGKPLYRTPDGKLLPLWTTIGDVNHMMVLDTGNVNNISMIWDPLPSTMRMKIWEEVKF